MPIPPEQLNRTLLPRILPPSALMDELLLLFARHPRPQEALGIIRVGDEYAILTLNDLESAFPQYSSEILTLRLAEIPGLLRSSAPLQLHDDDAIAQQRATAAPHGSLVVLDEQGQVVGVLGQIWRPDTKGPPAILALIEPQRPTVLSFDDPPDVAAGIPHLNAHFDGLEPNAPLLVGRRHILVVDVGAALAPGSNLASRPFAFRFADQHTVDFTVQVDADPDCWTIKPIEPTLRLATPGMTTQAAEFQVQAKQPGRDKLRVSIERADSGAVVQNLWLPVEATDSTTPQPPLTTVEYSSSSLPLDSTGIQRQVEITLQPGIEDFVAIVRADLGQERIRETYRVPVSVQELQAATHRLRNELERIVFFVDEESGRKVFASSQTLTVPEAIARQACVALADAGQIVWQTLFGGPRTPAGLRQLAERIRDLPEGSSIQIVLDSRSFILPWALLYDRPGPIDATTLDWHGFWGYRYVLDVLPPGRYPEAALRQRPSAIQLLFNDEQELAPFTKAQEALLRADYATAVVDITWGGTEAQQTFTQALPADLLYFYCHGMHAASNTQLAAESAIRLSQGHQLRIADLRRLPARALPRHALVFLNACEGATQEPFFYDGFMPFFIEELGARCFIGTEVKTPQFLAYDFGVRVLQKLARGEAIGRILWELRRYYLDQHHTILACNYSLYGLGDTYFAAPPNAVAASG